MEKFSLKEINRVKRRLVLTETIEEIIEFCDPENVNSISNISKCLRYTVKDQKSRGTISQKLVSETVRNLDKIQSQDSIDNIVNLYKILYRLEGYKKPVTKVKNFAQTINMLFNILPNTDEFLESELVVAELLHHLNWAKDTGLTKDKIGSVMRALQCYLVGYRKKGGKKVKCDRVKKGVPGSFAKELKSLRYQSYTDYENGFADYSFKIERSQPSIKSKDVSVQELLMFDSLKEKRTEQELDTIINNVYKHVEEYMYDVGDGSTRKYDLIYTGNEPIKYGDLELIEKGDKIEVKKMKTTTDSYLSEFFALDKNEPYISMFTKNKTLRVNFNYVITGLYEKLKQNEQGFIDNIIGDMKGMFFDELKYTPISNIKFYLSLIGQRKGRLTLRFNVIDQDKVFTLNKKGGKLFFTK